jgi:hypothetical protein
MNAIEANIIRVNLRSSAVRVFVWALCVSVVNLHALT